MGITSEKLEQLEDRCRKNGLRLTVQKRKVLSSLLEHEDHPTADDIYNDVKEEIPGVSRTTVYRILESFTEADLADKVYHPDDQYRFDPNTEHHHHLVCRSCDQVMDVSLPEKDAFSPPDDLGEDFEVDDFSIYFQGICKDCREEQVSNEDEA